ncbi:MAG: hypothetical protein KF745_07550 [Phycisphaeraceae bacterium]|nr:hypothetical protein [Phycisphaeraceae bacterium]
MRTAIAARVIVASLCFGAAHALVWRTATWTIQSWVVDLGDAAGCGVYRISGQLMLTEGGPFHGDGGGAAAWNVLYRNAPWWAAAAAGCAGALVGYWVCALPLGRTRLFGTGGVTRCGGCGYELSGLREPRCPECGARV